MEAIYKVIYDHPNGDHHESPSVSLKEMDDECNVPRGTCTEETLIEIMKDLFKTRKSTRESNIQIVRTVGGVSKVVYEQKKF